jgi:ribose transport system substrate-binding protein
MQKVWRRWTALTRLTAAVGVFAVVLVAATGGASAASSALPSQLAKSPATVKAEYAGYGEYTKIFGNPLGSYKAPKAPYKFCESTNYLGNGWEQGNQAELQALVKQYQKAGLAKPGLTTENSNQSLSTQVTQMNSLISDGCNVIFAIPQSTTALCPEIAKALKDNILVITDDTPVECPASINSSFSEFESAKDMASQFSKAIGGKGNIIAESGIPGAVGAQTTLNGFKAGLASGVTMNTVAGDWSDATAETATTTYLQTHPQTVDGILDGSGMMVGGELALQQAGRPLAKASLYEDECSAMALWKQHPGLVVSTEDQGPALAAYESFYVAAKLLAGAKPTVNTLFYPIPGPTQATFNQWYKPGWTTKSTCFATPPASGIPAASYYNTLLKGGAKLKVALKIVSVG